MDVGDIVRGHYSRTELDQVVLRGLSAAGVDVDALTVADLGPVDNLHAGGAPATGYLLDQLSLNDGTRLLDVGCGIGGPSRLAAAQYGCPVVGVDLSPDFLAVAGMLTERVGLGSRVEYRVSDGSRLEFAPGSFDRAMMIHVGMNVADKAALFAEVRRVLRPDGTFGLFEQMQTGQGDVAYPLPWADDERSSFVGGPDAYAADLMAAGFAVERVENRTAATLTPPDGQSRLSPMTIFGPEFRQRLANNIAATRAGVIAPVLIIARAA